MSRRLSCRRWSILALIAAACSSSPTVVPTKNLDRPTDMTFVCLGMVGDASGTPLLTGLGMEACHPHGALDPGIYDDGGQRTLGTFAFIPNAGRGELAVADMDKGRLLDLGPRAPGYGMLPVGGDPEAVAASPDGCWVVTANRTSCDFALVDPARLLVDSFSTETFSAMPVTSSGEIMRRLVVRTGAGRPLRASTGEIAFLPPVETASGCRADAKPRAVATFPGCDLVATLELSFADGTATITSAYFIRSDLPGGFQAAGSEPVCPVEDCAARSGDGAESDDPIMDGGSAFSLDGGPPAGGGALAPLALVPDGTRVYVAGLRDSAVTVLDIGANGLANPVRIELAENPGGVSRLRLALDPYVTTQVTDPDGVSRTVTGQFLRARGAFLYAVAADASIRVLNLDSVQPIECDVNIVTPPPDANSCLSVERVQQASPCFPVGTPGRRPLAQGPGIRIPTASYPNSPPPLPRDLAFVDMQPSSQDTNYHALSGQFGLVLAANGQVYVLNLAPNGEDGTGAVPSASCATHLPANASCLPTVATHSFREVRDVGQCARSALAVSIAPQRQVVQSDQAFPTTATFSGDNGPHIKSFSVDSGETTSWLDFPDRDTVVSQKWDVVWEGVLPGTARSSGIVHRSPDGRTAGALSDAGAGFCASSVQPGDVLTFAGCTKDEDCQPDDQFSCQVSVSGARGMCLPIDSTTSAALIERCGRLMGSRMRYEVEKATKTELGLRLKLDEVPKTTLNPCTQDEDCWPDVEHGSQEAAGIGGRRRRAFECVEVQPQERRCVQRCSEAGSDSECRTGHVCEVVPWVEPSGGTFCVEAPPIDQECFPQPMTAYSVRAGKAFTVTGSAMPDLHSGRVDSDGTCRYDAAPHPSLVNRIPLSAPACPESFLAQAKVGGATFVQNLSAEPGSNPCLYQDTGTYNDGENRGAEGGQRVRAYFQNPQIRFVMSNLDQYVGDLLAIHFELQYGFVPLTVQTSYDVLLTMGTRLIVGPTKTPESPIRQKSAEKSGTTMFPYLYVVDQGRSYLTAGSRGQVLRINPRAGTSEIAAFDTTFSGSTPFHLQ